MKLFLFGASVFYLLGLKLTSSVEIKSSLSAKPAIIESKTFPQTKQNLLPLEFKPELLKKDTAISSEIKSSQLIKTPKNKTFPQS